MIVLKTFNEMGVTTTSATKIAAILPVYNGEKYLSEALSSVFSQDSDDWTLYVINDGSTDATSEIIREWKIRYPDKIRSLQTGTNSGAATACNIGLDEAHNHPFVVIVNADDIQEPARFSKLLRRITATNTDIVMHDCEIINKSGEKTGRSKGFESHITQRNVLAEQLRRNHFWIGLAMLKNTPDIRFDPQIRISEDYDLFTKLFFNGATFAYLDEKLLFYRIHNQNLSLGYQKSEVVFNKIFEKYDLNDLEMKIEESYDEPGEMYISLAQVCIYRQQWNQALVYIDKGIDRTGNYDHCLQGLLFMKGYLLYLMNQYTQSLEATTDANRFPYSNPAVLNNMGVLTYLVSGDGMAATSLFQKALEMEPLYSDAQDNMEALKSGDRTRLRVTPRLLRNKVIRTITT